MLVRLLFFALTLGLAWLLLHRWYFRLVDHARSQVRHRDGRTVPSQPPRFLMGNLVEVYRARNRLTAYDSFHEKFGEMVQIFWLWRQQISLTDYQMARYILAANYKNYRKYPPNWVLQRLYGSSVLTNNGDEWKRHRVLMNYIFSKKRIPGFHDIFVSYSTQLAAKWEDYIEEPGESTPLDVYPELTALSLDIVSQAVLGHHLGALHGEMDDFLKNLAYILNQSTRPVHEFTRWWKDLPLASNRKLAQALEYIDDFHDKLIGQRKVLIEQTGPDSTNVLDLLLQATITDNDEVRPLTEKEVQNNVLAILVNGYETTAVTVALALYLLARYPEQQTQTQVEVDQVMQQGQLSQDGVKSLHYLDGIVNETLRLYPAVTGLQRLSIADDDVGGWSVPPKQAIGMSLQPLHLNARYFGETPEQFRPERYLNRNLSAVPVGQQVFEAENQARCPMHRHHQAHNGDQRAADSEVCLPLTFGTGPRKCLGEDFARYEMKVTLAILLHRFSFQIAPNFEVDMEIGKFGLFLTMFPQTGVQLMVSRREH